MQEGVHVVRLEALAGLGQRGVELPSPWLGVLDLLRAIEGLHPEPTAGHALGVVGLERLLEAARGDRDGVVQRVRLGLHQGKRYFAWKRIPLVFLVRCGLEAESDGRGPFLVLGTERVDLAPLLGGGLAPVPGSDGAWWWGAQLG